MYNRRCQYVEKVWYKFQDILVIVLFVILADADDWIGIAEFYEDYLKIKKYIWMENVVSSHDTIQMVIGMVSLEALQQLYIKWQEPLSSSE